jgi:hypothetical protein
MICSTPLSSQSGVVGRSFRNANQTTFEVKRISI